jgi:hypothetical protein
MVTESTSSSVVDPVPVSGGVWDFYGNPWVPSSLANLTLQANDRYSLRFTAKHSGVMDGFQNYMQANTSRTGYGGGTGGTIRYRLVPDNGNGLPNENNVLAETTWQPNLYNGSAIPPGADSNSAAHPIDFAQKHWPTKPTLQAGATYHIVIDNIDPNPNTNYLSINHPYATNGRTRSPHGPQNQHWGVTQNLGSGWHDYTEPHSGTRYEVNLMILMANGNHYGSSYMDPRTEHTISGSTQLRQIFTPTTTHTINQLSAYTSGTGTLQTTLKAGNTTIATWTNTTNGNNHNIINTGTHTLQAGTTYTLEFAATNGTLTMLTYREGSLGIAYTYPKGGAWDDGHAQKTTGNGWTDTFYQYADLAGVTFQTTN